MKKATIYLSLLCLLFLSLELETTLGDARTQIVETRCGNQLEHNTTIFVPNFVATMNNISSQMQTTGFGQAITGIGLDTNYGFAQCYGDLSLLDCVLCYAEARTVLPKCFPYNSGRIYLDGCFMRSENYSFFQEFIGPDDKAVCGNATRKSSLFVEKAKRAVMDVVARAPANQGYARAKVSGSGNATAYVLADCWKILNESSCRACLENASASVMECLPWSEGRALNTGCFLRYSDKKFLNDEKKSSKVSTIVMVVAIVSSIVVLVVAILIGLHIRKNRRLQKKRRGSNDAVKMAKTVIDSSLIFKYSTLEKATGSFDNANKIGQGGFGTVYKGVLGDGREVAVKRLFFNNRHRAADFYNEVNIISSAEHKNLVRLLGCSCSGPESLLVYEYLPNKSLDRFLFEPSRGRILNWEKRFEIIIGTVEGLIYLHENSKIKIIHRDIKSNNILLDSKLQAKIADFGLARSFEADKSHISTAIAGTLGYMAPEYLAHGQLTEKADVYSFGVLVIEIITGRQNSRSKTSDYTDSLVTAAWKHFQMGKAEELFDQNLMLLNHDNTINHKYGILRVLHVGLLCTQEVPSLRPSMSTALQMLLKDEELPAPANPPFIDEKSMEFNDTSDNPCRPLNSTSSFSVATASASSFYPR